MHGADAWEPLHPFEQDDLDNNMSLAVDGTFLRPTTYHQAKCADSLMNLLEAITERYQNLPHPSLQLAFWRTLQRPLLLAFHDDHLVRRLKAGTDHVAGGDASGSSSFYGRLAQDEAAVRHFAMLENTLQYCVTVWQDWRDDVVRFCQCFQYRHECPYVCLVT